jgi:hypothetical protein
MKKFIQASALSGICLMRPQAKPMKISPKNGKARLRMSTIAWPGSLPSRPLGAALALL